MSGHPGKSRRCKRYLNPAAQTRRRTVSSNFVFFPRIRDIRPLLASADNTSVTRRHPDIHNRYYVRFSGVDFLPGFARFRKFVMRAQKPPASAAFAVFPYSSSSSFSAIVSPSNFPFQGSSRSASFCPVPPAPSFPAPPPSSRLSSIARIAAIRWMGFSATVASGVSSISATSSAAPITCKSASYWTPHFHPGV